MFATQRNAHAQIWYPELVSMAVSKDRAVTKPPVTSLVTRAVTTETGAKLVAKTAVDRLVAKDSAST